MNTRRRFRLQFRLSTLMLMAAVFALLAPRIFRPFNMEVLAVEIRELGAHVGSDGRNPGLIYQIYCRYQDQNPVIYTGLTLGKNCEDPSRALKLAADIPSLERLDLTEGTVDDSAFSSLRKIRTMRYLTVQSQPLTDASAPIIARNQDMRVLSLQGTGITDRGVAKLRGLRELKVLSLRGTKVSDASVPHLAHLSSLRDLDLSNSDVSESAIQDLQRALPSCKIGRDQPWD